MEDGEDVFPTRHDVGGSCAHHLGHTANHHITDGYRPRERERERERESERASFELIWNGSIYVEF